MLLLPLLRRTLAQATRRNQATHRHQATCRNLAAAGALVMLLTASAQAQATLAAQRAAHLQHGINTGMWFAQAPGNYGVARLRAFTTADDLALIHSLGFDHIRLSIDPVPLEGWQRHTPDGMAFMAELDRVVGTANADHLAVIIDIHPEEPYKATLFTGSDGVAHFAALWVALAQHFGKLDPSLVFFEIMNEPQQNDVYRWNGIEAAVAAQIRAAAPGFTIIASGGRYDGLPDMLALQPLALDNVIYTFHDYEPFTFTHQSATWTGTLVEPLRNVPYPSSPADVAANVAQEPTLDAGLAVAEYGMDRWDAARVNETIGFAKRWSELHHVPVYCGEFGVYKNAVNEADRDRWLHDMRTALEADGIGWAMWEYQTSFGVVSKADGATAVDQGVVKALGLRAAQ